MIGRGGEVRCGGSCCLFWGRHGEGFVVIVVRCCGTAMGDVYQVDEDVSLFF